MTTIPKLSLPYPREVRLTEITLLSGRAQHVIRMRREGMKLSELAEELRCHIDRVRQLERSAQIEVRNHREREAERRKTKRRKSRRRQTASAAH
jgi:DNA-binding CsgD family transcriptional regulator